MNPATLDDLLKIVPNKYLLTMVIAQRAKQLERGAVPNVEMDTRNSLDIAIREVAEGKIDVSAILEQVKTSLDRQIEEDNQMVTEDMGVGFHMDDEGEVDPDRVSETGDEEV